MNHLIFSLNATLPIFIVMIIGLFLKKYKIIDDGFVSKANKLVFQVCLPLLVFQDLVHNDFVEAWDSRFVLFCFVVTVLSIIISIVLAKLFVKKKLQGEFIQGSYRSSAAILGIALIQNIYGTSVMGPLMILGSVPLYNMMAVIVLSLFHEEISFNKKVIKKTLLGIIKNPIIIGIICGIVVSLMNIPIPTVLDKSVDYVARLATPLGLMAMGASFHFEKVLVYSKETLLAVFMKLIGFSAIFLPIAIMIGFRNDQLIAILVMLASATTVSSYIMARNMGHEGVLTTGIVMLSTLLCAFSITIWLFVLKGIGVI